MELVEAEDEGRPNALEEAVAARRGDVTEEEWERWSPLGEAVALLLEQGADEEDRLTDDVAWRRAEVLAAAREAIGLSQRKVAQIVGVDRKTLGRAISALARRGDHGPHCRCGGGLIYGEVDALIRHAPEDECLVVLEARAGGVSVRTLLDRVERKRPKPRLGGGGLGGWLPLEKQIEVQNAVEGIGLLATPMEPEQLREALDEPTSPWRSLP